MSTQSEFPCTIQLSCGCTVPAPPEFDSRRPDPDILAALEAGHVHGFTPVDPGVDMHLG